MLILTIRTDKPEAEVGLYEDRAEIAYDVWTAHRELGATLHKRIKTLLESVKTDWNSIGGIVVYAGPGSFTGLRIGITVGNALAQGLAVSIVGARNSGWRSSGVERLLQGEDEQRVVPDYGAPVHITPPKK